MCGALGEDFLELVDEVLVLSLEVVDGQVFVLDVALVFLELVFEAV